MRGIQSHPHRTCLCWPTKHPTYHLLLLLLLVVVVVCTAHQSTDAGSHLEDPARIAERHRYQHGTQRDDTPDDGVGRVADYHPYYNSHGTDGSVNGHTSTGSEVSQTGRDHLSRRRNIVNNRRRGRRKRRNRARLHHHHNNHQHYTFGQDHERRTDSTDNPTNIWEPPSQTLEPTNDHRSYSGHRNDHSSIQADGSVLHSQDQPIPHFKVDIIRSPDASPNDGVKGSSTQNVNRHSFANPNEMPPELHQHTPVVSRRFMASQPYTARFVDGKNVANIPHFNSQRNGGSFPRTVTSEQENTHENDDGSDRPFDYRNHLSSEDNARLDPNRIAAERRRRRLKNNVANESKLNVARNRYRAHATVNEIPHSDAAPYVNPFDELYSPHATDESRRQLEQQYPTVATNISTANVSRIYGGSFNGAVSNHYTFRMTNTNGELSAPHYRRALHGMNKPVTPYNWRRKNYSPTRRPHRVSSRPSGRYDTNHTASIAPPTSDDSSSPITLRTSPFLTYPNRSTPGHYSSYGHSPRTPITSPRGRSLQNSLPPSAAKAPTGSRSQHPYDSSYLRREGDSPHNYSDPTLGTHPEEPSSVRLIGPGPTASVRALPLTAPHYRGGRRRVWGGSIGGGYLARSSSTWAEQDNIGPAQPTSSSSSSAPSHGEGSRAEGSKKRPNILLFLTDDLDVELGSLKYMPKLQSLMGSEGGVFPHSYTSTPMCCPSRSSMLTGMYIHNHEVYTNNDNCSSTRWQETHERRTFATYLSDAGYNTGYFGKYLNKYKGPYTPSGWRDWMGLRLNSRYYNYTVFKNGQRLKYGDSYPHDYFPHVITEEGVRFLREHRRDQQSSPFLLVLSYPAPHGPEDAAPEFNKLFMNATDHHTVAYDYAPNPDKQWILQYTSRMSPLMQKFTNVLMTKRLQTLQSVDQAIERVINELRRLDELDNTYIFFTSDHGYHLGQFGLIKGKSMNFEFDVKVPMYVRGPGIAPNREYSEIALNVDLAPTFLDIAGVTAPPHMDGRSLYPVLTNTQGHHSPWRQSFLIESSGRHRDEEVFEMKAQKRYQQLNRLLDMENKINSTLSDMSSTPSLVLFTDSSDNSVSSTVSNINNTLSTELASDDVDNVVDNMLLYTSKHEHLETVCQSEELRAPCTPLKKWRCHHDGIRWRLKKCRHKLRMGRGNCVCGPDMGMGYLVRLDQEERRRQRTFLRQHVNQDLRRLSPKFLKAFVDVDSSEVARDNIRQRNNRRRQHRVTRSAPEEEDTLSSSRDAVYDYVEEAELKDIERQIDDISDELHVLETASNTSSSDHRSRHTNDTTQEVAGGCTAVDDAVVDCPEEVYSDKQAWRTSKYAIDEEIRRLSHQMRVLKSIRQHLRVSRPRLTFTEGKDKNKQDRVHSQDVNSNGTDVTHDDVHITNFEDLLGFIPELEYSNEGGSSRRVEFTADSGEVPSTIIEGYDYTSSSPSTEASTDPDHFTYTGGYRGNKGNRVAVYVPEQQAVCWCNRKAALQHHIKEQKMQRILERRRLRQERVSRRLARRQQRRNKHPKEKPCNLSQQNCYQHDNDHWKTPPLWTDGSFCACLNSANNTYWCVRTINVTHNTLYCEFITGLITYYDLNIDPYQLRNVAFMLENSAVTELHNTLTVLRSCKGVEECDLQVQQHPALEAESTGTESSAVERSSSTVDDNARFGVNINELQAPSDSHDSFEVYRGYRGVKVGEDRLEGEAADHMSVVNKAVKHSSVDEGSGRWWGEQEEESEGNSFTISRSGHIVNKLQTRLHAGTPQESSVISNEVTNTIDSVSRTKQSKYSKGDKSNNKLKKEEKRRRKLLRRLRKEQKRKRLGKNAVDVNNSTSVSGTSVPSHRSRKHRRLERREKRRRRLERKLKEMTESLAAREH